MDTSVRRSLSTLQGNLGGTPRSREAKRRGTTIPVSRHNKRSPSRSASTGGREDPTASLLHKQGSARSRIKIQQVGKASLSAPNLLEKVEAILPESPSGRQDRPRD
ncbi:uncharacterized protein DS421_2g54190 [Arachis hypogaea]|nr:uncharacterized protein DS421_2g54190 [Arachis hypogaea]